MVLLADLRLRLLALSSYLVERQAAVIVCYLDDSGKDAQNPITLLGGYSARADCWESFEQNAEPIFQQYIGGSPLHATDLHHGKGVYKNWKVLKKQSFVTQLCMQLYPLRPLLGVSFAVRKASYSVRAKEALKRGLRKHTVTPYTFCLDAILNWMLTDIQVGRIANEEGLALILESGNEHNTEAKQSFETIKKLHGLEQLRSLTFVDKSECRAIQMADLFAFYTRRHNRHIQQAGKEPPTDPVLKVMLEGLQYRTYVATDFGPKIKASRFFAGDP